jgi:hypothetical protein
MAGKGGVVSGDLPADIDPELWFPCAEHPGERDYLWDARWHTHVGRMAAYCPTRGVSFRVSYDGMPQPLPTATRYWVAGFLAGNLPAAPGEYGEDSPAMRAWTASAEEYFRTGQWKDAPSEQ